MDLSDGELLRRSAAGEEAAFTALYRRFHGSIYRFAHHMSGCRSTAEEVTQEVFLALIRQGGDVDTERPLVAWLLGVARNHVLKRRHGDSRYQSLASDAAIEPVAEPDQLEELTRHESIDKLRRAVLALPPRYREVVVLCELEEMSYEEAARVLGCATGTVRSRLHRARALLTGRLRIKARCTA